MRILVAPPAPFQSRRSEPATTRVASLSWLTLLLALAVLLPASAAQAVTLVGGPVTTNTTWSLANSPYEVTSSITVSNTAKLTVEAGVTVRFRAGTGLMIGKIIADLCQIDCQEAGRLEVLGTAAKPVTFTSKSGQRDWRGVGFGPATDAGAIFSTLRNLVVDRAGQSLKYGGTVGLVSAGLSFVGTGNNFIVDSVTVQNCAADGWVLRDATLSLNKVLAHANGGVGLRAQDSQLMVTKSTVSNNSLGGMALRDSQGLVSDNRVEGNGQYGITAEPSDPNLASELTLTSNTIKTNSGYGLRCYLSSPPDLGVNTITSNNNPGVLMVGALLPGSLTIPKQFGDANVDIYSAPIRVDQGHVLQIEAGVELRFAPHTGLEIGGGEEPGTLFAVGEPAAPIVFTALNGLVGGWLGLTIEAGDAPLGAVSWLEHVVITKGGELDALGLRKNAVVFGNGPQVTWVDVTSSNGAGHGLMLSASSMDVVGGEYTNNGGSGIFLEENAAPAVQNVDIVDNGGPGIGADHDSGNGFNDVFIQDCIITDNGGSGIDVPPLAGTVQFNTIAFNDGFAVRYSTGPHTPAVLDNTFEGNAQPGIELATSIQGGYMYMFNGDSQQTLHRNVGEPTVTFDSNAEVSGGTVVIEAGQTLRFPPGAGLLAGYHGKGSIVLAGTAEAPIVMTAANGVSGGWRGVALGPIPPPALSSLSYVVIDKAGGLTDDLPPAQPFRAALAFHSAPAEVKNVTIVNSAGDGLFSFSGAPTIQNAVVAFNLGLGVRFAGPNLLTSPTIDKLLLFSSGPNIGLPTSTLVLTADPLFTNPAAGDFTAQPGSPLIDAGLPNGLAFFGNAPDLGGVENGQ